MAFSQLLYKTFPFLAFKMLLCRLRQQDAVGQFWFWTILVKSLHPSGLSFSILQNKYGFTEDEQDELPVLLSCDISGSIWGLQVILTPPVLQLQTSGYRAKKDERPLAGLKSWPDPEHSDDGR